MDVKITAANQHELMLIYIARQLYLSDEGQIDKVTQLELLRHFKKNYERAGNAQDMLALKTDLQQYMQDLRSAGVKDWELKNLDTSTWYNICRLIYSMIYVFSACTIVTSSH